MPAIGRLFAELRRLELMGELEQRLARAGFASVAGVDEAGRGSLAGPVVAAAVIPDPRLPIPAVDDSKRLPAALRERLAETIRSTARAWAVVEVSAVQIDASDILRATRAAMLQAVRRLDPTPHAVVSDAVPLPELGLPALALVKGDALCFAVACASILAKQHRDRRLAELDAEFPQYGFARHKGYAAEEHLAALARYGPSRVHRLSFGRVVPRRQAA